MSRPGKDDGYALVDAVVALLIVSIGAAVLSGLDAAGRTAAGRFERAAAHIEERNAYATKLLGALRDGD
jgi:hypothetical protein